MANRCGAAIGMAAAATLLVASVRAEEAEPPAPETEEAPPPTTETSDDASESPETPGDATPDDAEAPVSPPERDDAASEPPAVEGDAKPATGADAPPGSDPYAASEAPPVASGRSAKRKETPPSPRVRKKSKKRKKKPLPPAQPLDARLTLQIPIDTTWYTDSGYGLFSENKLLTVSGFSLAYDVVLLSPELRVLAEMGITGGEDDDGVLLSSAGTHGTYQVGNFYLGGILRHEPLPFLALRGRLSGGMTIATAELQTDIDEPSAEESYAPFGAIGGGIELFMPAMRTSRTRRIHNSVSFGVIAEGGYTLTSSLDVAFPDRAQADEGEPRIREVGADLGSIQRSGAYLRIGLFARL